MSLRNLALKILLLFRSRNAGSPAASGPAASDTGPIAGPDQAAPSSEDEEAEACVASLRDALDFVRRQGAGPVALCFKQQPSAKVVSRIRTANLDVTGFVEASGTGGKSKVKVGGLAVMSLTEAAKSARLDAVIVIDRENLHIIMRWLEPLARRGLLILPMAPDWVVPPGLKDLSPMDAAWSTSSAVNYVARSALGGHYLEFGTFWGAQFFPAYFCYRHFLKGKFYAFDSFEGLSAPHPQETDFQPDFQSGNYCCNERTFRALAEFVGVAERDLVVVPGFYSDTLVGGDPAAYGLEPESVSVCFIDCDLFEPTRQVLDFVLSLLEPGALIYFDDWRLCRASPNIGERGAALDWLRRHPEVELVEFHRDHWQHQWFIFHRRRD